MRNSRAEISRSHRYLWISGVVLIIFIMIFVMFINMLSKNELQSFDQTWIDLVQGNIHNSFTPVMKFFTLLGSGKILSYLMFACVILMLLRKRLWEAVFLTLGLTGGSLFNSLLKSIFRRERPSLHRLIDISGYSFPSGHSMASFIFYGMLAVILTAFVRTRLLKAFIVLAAALLIIMIGTSRIYLGVHYPSDVAAGFAAGGIWMIVCLIGLHTVLEKIRKEAR